MLFMAVSVGKIVAQQKTYYIFVSPKFTDDTNTEVHRFEFQSKKPYEITPMVLYSVRSNKSGVCLRFAHVNFSADIGDYIPHREFDRERDQMKFEALSREEFDEGAYRERYYMQDILDNWTREEIWDFFGSIRNHKLYFIDDTAGEMGNELWLREVKLTHSNEPRPGDIQIIQSGE